jgi:hypothetical protein
LPSRPKHVSLLAQNFFNRIIHQREDHDAVRMLDQLRGIVTFRTDVSYPDFYDLLARSDLMLLDFASDDYLRIKASSTVAAAVITGVRGLQRPQAMLTLATDLAPGLPALPRRIQLLERHRARPAEVWQTLARVALYSSSKQSRRGLRATEHPGAAREHSSPAVSASQAGRVRANCREQHGRPAGSSRIQESSHNRVSHSHPAHRQSTARVAYHARRGRSTLHTSMFAMHKYNASSRTRNVALQSRTHGVQRYPAARAQR